jgi:hypothetical protein
MALQWVIVSCIVPDFAWQDPTKLSIVLVVLLVVEVCISEGNAVTCLTCCDVPQPRVERNRQQAGCQWSYSGWPSAALCV